MKFVRNPLKVGDICLNQSCHMIKFKGMKGKFYLFEKLEGYYKEFLCLYTRKDFTRIKK